MNRREIILGAMASVPLMVGMPQIAGATLPIGFGEWADFVASATKMGGLTNIERQELRKYLLPGIFDFAGTSRDGPYDLEVKGDGAVDMIVAGESTLRYPIITQEEAAAGNLMGIMTRICTVHDDCARVLKMIRETQQDPLYFVFPSNIGPMVVYGPDEMGIALGFALPAKEMWPEMFPRVFALLEHTVSDCRSGKTDYRTTFLSH